MKYPLIKYCRCWLALCALLCKGRTENTTENINMLWCVSYAWNRVKFCYSWGFKSRRFHRVCAWWYVPLCPEGWFGRNEQHGYKCSQPDIIWKMCLAFKFRMIFKSFVTLGFDVSFRSLSRKHFVEFSCDRKSIKGKLCTYDFSNCVCVTSQSFIVPSSQILDHFSSFVTCVYVFSFFVQKTFCRVQLW